MKKKVFIFGQVFVSLLYVAVLLTPSSCELAEDFLDTDAGKLEGEWLCNEQSELYKATSEIYTVYIALDADAENRIIIDNFYQLGDVGLRATVSGSNITISSQTLEGGFTVAGSGTISANSREIEWIYTVDDGSHVIDHVTAEYTKK